jgi:hypothetical protein
MISRHPIASRTFTIGLEGMHTLETIVRAPVEDDGAYRCDYDLIEDGTVTTSFHGMGVDSLQALISALQRLGVDIAFSDLAMKRDLYWNDQNDDLGLILPPNCAE